MLFLHPTPYYTTPARACRVKLKSTLGVVVTKIIFLNGGTSAARSRLRRIRNAVAVSVCDVLYCGNLDITPLGCPSLALCLRRLCSSCLCISCGVLSLLAPRTARIDNAAVAYMLYVCRPMLCLRRMLLHILSYCPPLFLCSQRPKFHALGGGFVMCPHIRKKSEAAMLVMSIAISLFGTLIFYNILYVVSIK